LSSFDHAHRRVGEGRARHQQAEDGPEQHELGGLRGPVHPLQRVVRQALAQPVEPLRLVLHLLDLREAPVAGPVEGLFVGDLLLSREGAERGVVLVRPAAEVLGLRGARVVGVDGS
jgi:hypothetical protein